jgi:hypothetical protein
MSMKTNHKSPIVPSRYARSESFIRDMICPDMDGCGAPKIEIGHVSQDIFDIFLAFMDSQPH